MYTPAQAGPGSPLLLFPNTSNILPMETQETFHQVIMMMIMVMMMVMMMMMMIGDGGQDQEAEAGLQRHHGDCEEVQLQIILRARGEIVTHKH